MDIADHSGNRLLDIHIVPASRLSEFHPTPASFVVVTVKDTVLLVFDRWRAQWELPGGMREPGETARQAAVRELAEETGVQTTDLDFAAAAEFARWTRRPPGG
jgi:8-oxo-dGTP pyrophosphatase MutT (NUDIX family)